MKRTVGGHTVRRATGGWRGSVGRAALTGAALAAAASLSGLSACGGARPGEALAPQGEVLRTVGFDSIEDMADASTVVAVGMVTGNADNPVRVPDGVSVPAVTFEVEETVRGRVEPGKQLVVRYTAMGGGPSLKEGTRYLLFLDDFWLDPDVQAPTGEHVVVGMWAGMYEERGQAEHSPSPTFVKLDPDSRALPEELRASDLEDLSATP